MACKVQMLLSFGSKHFFNTVSHTIITHSDTQVTTTDHLDAVNDGAHTNTQCAASTLLSDVG